MPSGPRRAPFALGVFLGAFLLFLVQPLVARQILPWFGGGPAVWSACLLFFQIALVAGYGYAHLTRRLGLQRQAALHLALLAMALLTLPVGPSAFWKPVDGSALVPRVLLVLAATTGPVFVLVAATAPLLQDWMAQAYPDRSPYRLYVLSNTGSLGALLAYPLLVEPALDMTTQRIAWSGGFLLFAGACAWCAAIVRRAAAHALAGDGARSWSSPIESSPLPPSTGDRVRWIAYPAAGTGLLLATTSQLSQDVASVPLLWVVPLALYLLTYILAFAGWYRRAPAVVLFALAIGAAFWADGEFTPAAWARHAVALLGVLTAGCAICHGELAARRPVPRYLTAYYLALSIGGALGGLLVALAAPVVFDDIVELPILLIGVCLVTIEAVVRDVRHRPGRLFMRVAVTAIAAATTVAVAPLVVNRALEHEVARRRGFYGVLRVVDEPRTHAMPTRRLIHGQILHGVQFLDPMRAMQPASYYAEGSGIALAIARHPRRLAGEALAIGAVGLGAGTIAALGVEGDAVRFFEIDPVVLDVSRAYFTFLRDSPATVDVAMGDARLTLEREVTDPARRHRYDVIAVDAFSGDAIPTHLLTREAFATYQAALAPDGVLAIHVSNRYLDLRPVVHGLAEDAGWPVIDIASPADAAIRASSSDWLLVTRNPSLIGSLADRAVAPGEAHRTVLWTDSHSSLLAVIKREAR